MKLTGLHLLLTYQCTFECDHCFVWGSPWQNGTMTTAHIDQILLSANQYGQIESIYFEGGEPFLYYPILLYGVQQARQKGYKTGIVSNAYWATSLEDGMRWLEPFVNLIDDLSVSSDLFHYSEKISQQACNAQRAAEILGISVGMISIAKPEYRTAMVTGQLPTGESSVMYRGRAAAKLVTPALLKSWFEFRSCPHENLKDPGRVHVDPLGFIHICQGITIGNIYTKSLDEICSDYSIETHPITAPIYHGGPAQLVNTYNIDHADQYADACHLCYESRQLLRSRFAEYLGPDQMYGYFDR